MAGFDRSDIARTANAFHVPGGVFELRIPKAGKSKTISGYYDDARAFADAVVGLADDEFPGCYFTINSTKPELLARCANQYKRFAEVTTSDADILARRWLPIDLDPARPSGISSSDTEHDAALEMARKIRGWLIERGWPENAFVLADSGNGAHLVARIDLPNDEAAKNLVKRCLEALNTVFSSEKVKVDTTTFNAARIWKIYGTMARKGSSTHDRPHRLAKLLEVPEILETVSRETLEELAGTTQESESAKQETGSCRSGFDPKKYAEAHGASVLRVEPWTDPEGGKWELAILAECPFDSSHNRGEARIGVREDGLRTFRCFHSSCQGKDWHALRDLWEPNRKAKAEAEPKSENGSALADIQVNGRYLQEITADVMAALEQHNEPPQIFVQSGHLARIKSVQSRSVIEPLGESALRGLMARSAGFVKYDGEDDNGKPKFVKVRPPLDVARDVLSLGSWSGFPGIEGVIETPTIRLDGSILAVPGYDEATRLYYAPSGNLDGLHIDEMPSQEDARNAAGYIITEIFSDFPFKDEASKANALALILSAVARPLIDGGVPLALIDKPQAGTGASFLADVASTIATTRPAHMMGAPETEDEWRKLITSALLDGNQVDVFDNLTGKLRSASLTRALTSRIWRDRLLGKTEMVDILQRAVWIATGNNISIGGDIARRSYWIRMDASMARPWLRTGFRHDDLLGWIKTNHAAILSALLTMSRAWVAAGRPEGKAKALGGFQEWSTVIGGILEFAGVEGFLGNASELYDSMDQDVQQWDAFLEAWAEIHADHAISAGTLRDDLISTNPISRTLQDAMPDDVSEAVRKDRRASLSLGVTLGKHIDQIYPSGRKLCREKDSHSKANLWKVEFAGSGQNQEPKSSDGFAGSAGSNPIHQHIFGNQSKSDYSILVEQLPALPANQQQATESGEVQLPANKHVGSPKSKKADPEQPEKVRIIASPGYRTQIPVSDNPGRWVDHLYNFGEIAEFPHWRAKNLIDRGIAEAIN
ncbi:MAG: hypothetical protein HPY61_01630 [Methanotrichaceae archaeon]|nr:hypothetical protein [Methanotrichaceae archaeon]